MSSNDLSLLWSIAWRFLRGRRSRLMDSTARAALIAISIGVTAMVIAMALMTGYQKDLQRKLVRGNAAVIVYPLAAGGLQLHGEELAKTESLPGVVEVRRVTYGQGSVASEKAPDGLDVTLRGVDLGQGIGSLGAVALVPGLDPDRPLEAGEIPGVVLGTELARKLDIGLGDALRLMVLGFDGRRGLGFKYRSIEVVGTFTTGFSEFDQSWVVIGRSTLEGLMGREVGSALYEIELADANMAGAVAGRIREILGSDFLVTDWRDLNRELFTALEVQKIALFFVLGLIVVVSTFNVASSLVVLVRERMRDVGVLASLGLSPPELRTVFLLYGGALGLAGTLFGVALGVAASWVLTEYEIIRFDPDLAEIYFIDSVPFRVEAPDVLAVMAFTLLVTLVACWLPARRAGSVLPATALRYE